AVGYHQNETFYMGEGNDTVNAADGNDTIHGEEGNDSLYGQKGDDTLIGGTGDDRLYGGEGADTYYIGAADGDDIIDNYDATDSRQLDKIVYGEGVLVDDISITRSGNDLLISNAKTEQTTVIAGAYNHEFNRLYNLEFYDEDTAMIDYATNSLNITYAVKEEIVEDVPVVEFVENVAADEIIEAELVEDVAAEEITEAELVKDVAAEEITEVELIEEVTTEEITETEHIEEIEIASEVVPNIEVELETLVENEENIYVQEEIAETESSEDAGSTVMVSEEDITKMTGLMVQEMAGTGTEGTPQIVNPDTNAVSESDSLLWTE
ncbi:MAG: hypothetical protein IJ397_04535, partial [Lachnospiraceae bacterium]|nr:hypothetical protein [Lachnospiraceae bacterium]